MKGSNIMKSINIKKMVPKFDTNTICSNLPYRINMGGNTYVGVFYIITEDRLEFKFFDEDGEIKFGVILPTADDIEISPYSVMDDRSDVVIQELINLLATDDNDETRKAYETMKAINNLDFSKLLGLKVEPEKTEEPVEEDEPNIKSFYICDMRTYDVKKYPLFVRNNGDLVINYDFMEKLLYDDNVLITIKFGIKGHSYALHTFESKDVTIHVGGTTLTGKIFDEYRNVTTCVEIRSDSWEQLEWARVYIKNKKDE